MKFHYKPSTQQLRDENSLAKTSADTIDTVNFNVFQWSLLLLFFITTWAEAEPYLAIKNNLKCAVCHVNPNGGGLRTEFGRIYGQNILPKQSSSYDSNQLAKITQFLSVGADARFNARLQRDDDGNNSQSFEIASSQLYLNVKLPDTGLSFYVDQQIAPGSAVNREAFVMYQFANQDYLRAGKIFLPYGLRIEDDSAFIRQATGMNFDNSDNGVEYGFNYASGTVNLVIANGTSQASNNDDSFLYGIRVEHLFSNLRLGASAVLNDGDQQSQLFNIYAGSQLGDFTFLAEVDLLRLIPANGDTKQDVEQLISLAEVNYQWTAGWNLKLTAEYLDSDRDIAENEQTRFSFIAEYTPFSNIQLRLGLRLKQDIPQKPQQNYDVIFLQSHFYF